MMMEAPSMDTVYQAISALYDNPNANEKEKASIWLGDVQKSIHSWKIADQILQEKKDEQSCYFAAQTMRSKVQHNLSELPSEAVVSLRDSLVAHLENAASGTKGNNNNEEIERLLFDSIASLEECYHMAVAHEEEEKAVNYAKVFTELAETFLEKIVYCTASGRVHFAMRSLELALVCVGHHDYEVAEITFNLWYRLSEEVYQRDQQPLTDAFKPHIERLIEALARHCQFEPDNTKLPDEGDEFYDFRMKVMELIKDVVFIVGSSAVFRQMFTALQANISWEQTEAALFIMQAVAKNILPDEHEYVPKVVEAILSMPEDSHVAVRRTCIMLLGELCEWIERHPACLQPCLHTLVRALQHRGLAPAAAAALQSVCKACRAQASAHVATLVAAARAADAAPQPLAGQAGATLQRALAAALGALPAAQLAAAMRDAAAGQLQALRALLAAPPAELRKGTRSDPVLWLDRLAALFRDVDVPSAAAAAEPHPCMPALEESWPVLYDVMKKWVGEARVMERACRCLRFAVRAVGRGCVGLMPQLSRVLPELYNERPHGCVLYLCGVLCDVVGAEAAAELLALLHALLPPALALLQAPGGLKDNPDTVDDLFRLCIRYLQHVPVALLSSGAAPSLLQCAALASRLDHRDANSSVMKFLYDLLRCANDADAQPDKRQIKELADEALSMYGEELTYALMEASVLHLHPYMLGEVGEVLLELVAWQKARHLPWLHSALARLPHDRPATATEQQCWHFHQYAMRAEKCKEMTKLLREFARLYR
ncbi:unnamed protein product, partial [Iphiclides podalirius]